MYKLAIISDIHFNNYKQHSRLVGGVNSRLLDTCNAVKEAFEKSADMGIKHMLIPGDIFHVRGTLKTGVLQYVMELFKELIRRYDIKVLAIPGNHDMEDYDGGPHAVYPLGYIEGFLVANNGNFSFADRRIATIPYYPKTSLFKEYYEEWASGCDIVMIHQGIDDARPNIMIPETGIKANDFKHITIAGHYHYPWCDGRVLSVGAPIQHNFGDMGQDRGFWTYDNKFEFHKLSYPEFISVDIGDLKSIDVSGKIVSVKTDDKRRVEDYSDNLKQAYSYVIDVERQFTSRHTEKINVSTPLEMLAQYLEFTDKYSSRKDELIEVARGLI